MATGHSKCFRWPVQLLRARNPRLGSAVWHRADGRKKETGSGAGSDVRSSVLATPVQEGKIKPKPNVGECSVSPGKASSSGRKELYRQDKPGFTIHFWKLPFSLLAKSSPLRWKIRMRLHAQHGKTQR